MSEVRLETITAIHIGSGETLQYGNDFVRSRDGEMIGIVDTRKVMTLIGESQVDRWVQAIERKETTDQIMQVYAPKASIGDYTLRQMDDWAVVKHIDTLKEQLHNGFGLAYIPGSSIKGAIRTAVLASLLMGRSLEQKIKDRKGQVSAKQIEGEIFGKDPNSDVFRFLQVGDAYLGENATVALRMVNINEKEKQVVWDKSKSQVIEAIAPNEAANFQLKLNCMQYEFSMSKVHALPFSMSSIQELFKVINKHTITLLEGEISYWNERIEKDESDHVRNYLSKIEALHSEAKSYHQGRECMLRIGHGSGWRFITGAWAESLTNFYTDIVSVARPNNKRYESYDFPKTRRIDSECELLGFVKLSIGDF